MGKKLSGAAKRKKKKEKEEAIERARADLERLKLGPTKLWTGLVTHHKDIFVSHVLPKLNGADRDFFSKANTESWDLLEYAGLNVSKMRWFIHECSSISTLEMLWNNMDWEKKYDGGIVTNQAWFCAEMALSNRLEFLRWAREVKRCEWNEDTIAAAANVGNLEILKYCFANHCPCDEDMSCTLAVMQGHLDCVRFLFDKLKPSERTKSTGAVEAAARGYLDILKYIVEEFEMTDYGKELCIEPAVTHGKLDCIKYLVEEARTPLTLWRRVNIALARYYAQTECLIYLRQKGFPEPTDEQYATFCERKKEALDHN